MKKSTLMIAGSVISFTLSAASPTFAQTAEKAPAEDAATSEDEEEDGDDGDVILVTGSRISRPESDGVLPGVQVTAEQIRTRGFTSVLDVLNDLPLVGPGASPNGTNGGQNASLGASFVDLLDLGTQRTLTLVNGRRFVSGNAASLFVAGNASGAQVDLNAIPSALVERTDVITVGGAAAYGSDAIAGVVNIILRDDYVGTQVTALGRISEEGDAGSYQLSGIIGRNFLDDSLNVVLSGEYTRNDGLQADARPDRLRRAGAIANFSNGGVRNPNFGPAIIDIGNLNNGAFLRAFDDNVPGVLFTEGIVNQGISFNGSVFNTITGAPAPFNTPINAGGPLGSRIILQNGIGFAGQSFFNTALQIIPGTPFAGFSATVNNGRAGRATAISNVPITTFAPTALPAGVTAAQVFTQFGITPPAGASAGQLTTLAINVLQANRPTAREFFANNPSVPTNAFIGSFFPGVPRIANTDTRLVTIAGVQVPLNQVLPFVAVPLELSADGNFVRVDLANLTPTTPSTLNGSIGSTGGFTRAIENVVLRAQQDRYIANFNVNFEITPELKFFSENLYSNTTSVSLRNSPSQNFLTTGAENAALVLNVNNPFLDAGDLAVLNSVGINAATRGGSFTISRQNQDIFGNNPQSSNVETYRLVGGLKYNGNVFGRSVNSEVSVTYGEANQRTETTQINDIEYQLALDSARDANGNIVCRAQLFPNQYLGLTPIGTVTNIVRLPGADGIPQEQFFVPTITQQQINDCRPLNPFGFGQFSPEAARYVRQDNVITNVSTQLFILGTLSSSLFDLPAGEFGFNVNAEYRKETLDFQTDALNRLGRGRAAPSAQTSGEIEVFEFGGELRIPILSEDFAPFSGFLGSLEFTPAIRISKQTGSSTQFRDIAGQIQRPVFEGDSETIWSLAGIWAPRPFLSFRGNVTRSLRQPSLVEVFLGGQPAFSAPADPCDRLAFRQGQQPVSRTANCAAAVIAAGINGINNTNDAIAFLDNFVANAGALAGTFNGSLGLRPERGESWTIGGNIKPAFLPNFILGADYISIDLIDRVIPLGLAGLLAGCFDDADGDTTSSIGFNACTNFSRGPDFQVLPGYTTRFVNQGEEQLRAINLFSTYNTEIFGNSRINANINAYHLARDDISALGDFSDTVRLAGIPGAPSWEVQSRLRFTNPKFFAQVTWNWTSRTEAFSDNQVTPGDFATIDDASDLFFPAYSIFDIAVGTEIDDKFFIQLGVANVGNKRFFDDITRGNFIDNIGRRFTLTVSADF